jgi:hypothetical protein
MADHTSQPVADEWVSFPGGELEGRRPKVLCPACRAALKAAAAAGRVAPQGTSVRAALCFQCYRAELDRERAVRGAGQLDTASDARFQTQLPFEPVNAARLAMLKAERSSSHGVMLDGAGRFVNARRQAQIAARRALQGIVAGVAARKSAALKSPAGTHVGANCLMDSAVVSAIHAAELQLPESWLPFVVGQQAVSR